MRLLVAVLVLAGGTFVLKTLGPLVVGDRPLSPRVSRLVRLLPAALLAALVAVQTFAVDGGLRPDARAIGVAAAAVALLARAPFAVVVIVAAAVTAAVRWLGWS